MERFVAIEKKKRSLLSKHHSIDTQLKTKSKNLSCDDLEIGMLKKKKLYIKDKIYMLKG